MTAAKLQSIALRLANGVPTRYWLHYNYPSQEPWTMALQVLSIHSPGEATAWDGGRPLAKELAGLGGVWHPGDRLWAFERTDAQGRPYRSAV